MNIICFRREGLLHRCPAHVPLDGALQFQKALTKADGLLYSQACARKRYEEPAQDGEDPEGEGRRGGQEDGHDGVIAPTPSYVFSEYQMDDLRGAGVRNLRARV